MRHIRMNYTLMVDYTYDVEVLPDDWEFKTAAVKHAWLRAHTKCSSTDMKEIRAVVDSTEVFPEIVDADVLG